MLPIATLITQGGTIVGCTWVLFQFIRWVVEFSCKRLDIRGAELTTREATVDHKMQDWQRKLEKDFRSLRIKVNVYEQATNMLVTELHQQDPSNATLAMVNRILAPYRTMRDFKDDPDADLLAELK